VAETEKDWADEKVQAITQEWYLLHVGNTGLTEHNGRVLRYMLAAALREAREPLEKEIAALHDLLTGCLSRLNPEEVPEWCEKIGEVLTCGQDGSTTPCTHYQKEMEEAYRDGFQQGREQGAREERAASYPRRQ
jgi:hypothetical protein